MTVSIVDHELPYDTHNLYDVTFFSDQINTLVTHTPSLVDTWISEIPAVDHLVVGLDVEWRPNFRRYHDNPAATLQLCTGGRCLIFQLIHAPSIPQSLIDFLGNKDTTFAGVGIENDVEKLLEDYGLSVANVLDLRVLAAEKYGERELRNSGLKLLTRRVLGKEVVKPRKISMSRWDNPWLTPAQVKYACIDAFLSFEIEKCLNAPPT